MKNCFLITSIIILSFTFFSCNDDETPGKKWELPEPAWEFINKYFPGQELVNYTEYDIGVYWENPKYYVVLSSRTAILFSSEGYWMSVTDINGLPEAFLSSVNEVAIKRDLINKLYPDEKIISIEPTMWGNRVGLSESGYLFIFYGAEDYLLGKIMNTNELPDKVKELIANSIDNINYPNLAYAIETLEEDVIGYNLIFSNSSYIYLDKDFNWFEIQSYSHGIKREIYNEIPDYIARRMYANYPSANLYFIKIMNGYYIFKIDRDQYVLVNKEGITQPKNDKVYDFADEHFEIRNDISPFINIVFTKENIYFSYRYTVIGGGTLILLTDLDGEWVQIRRIYDSVNYAFPLPQSLIETLPDNLQSYLEENYKDKPVTFLRRENNEYFTQIDNKVLLKFDNEGNFIEIVPSVN